MISFILKQRFQRIINKYPEIIYINVKHVKQQDFLIVDSRILCTKNEINTSQLIFELIKTIVGLRQNLLIEQNIYTTVSTKSKISHSIMLNFSNFSGIFINGSKNIIHDNMDQKSIKFISEHIESELKGYNNVISPTNLDLEFVYEYLEK